MVVGANPCTRHFVQWPESIATETLEIAARNRGETFAAHDYSRRINMNPSLSTPDVVLNPLWKIVTAMAGFFTVSGLVIAFG
jgi:hypothetical protein